MEVEKTYKKDYVHNWTEFILTGSKKALSANYLEHFDLLYSYGKKLTCHEHQVEDAIQNLFTNLLRNRDKLSMVRNVRAYLMASFHHESYSPDGSSVGIGDTTRIRQDAGSEVFNQMIVPYGKNLELTLADGTKVWLHSGSRLGTLRLLKMDIFSFIMHCQT